jgi:hypothetical protein
MSALEVQGDDKPDRVVAHVFAHRAVDAGLLCCSIAIAAIEDLTFEDPDRFVDAMGGNVGDQIVKLRALNKREDVCEWMKL